MKYNSLTKRIGYGGFALLASMTVGTMVLSAPVYARGGTDDGSTSNTTTTSTSGSGHVMSSEPVSGSGTGTATTSSGASSGGRSGAINGGTATKIDDNSSTENEAEVEIETHNGAHDTTAVRVSSLEDKAKQLLITKRAQSSKTSSVADRQKACTQHQGEVDTHFASYTMQAQAAFAKYGIAFANVQAYQSSHKLAVSGYDALVSDATTKQAAAQGAVSALANVSTKIDCTSSDPAAAIAAVKSAVATAKSALKDYRASVKAIVIALLQTKSTAATTTTEGTN